jgi:hypothetical protein
MLQPWLFDEWPRHITSNNAWGHRWIALEQGPVPWGIGLDQASCGAPGCVMFWRPPVKAGMLVNVAGVRQPNSCVDDADCKPSA